MLKLSDRAAGKIQDLLDDVWLKGVASIDANNLLLIYWRDRLTKSIWQDISERWEEMMLEMGLETPPELLIGYETGYDYVCFAYGNETDPETKQVTRFLRPIGTKLGEAGEEVEEEEAA